MSKTVIAAVVIVTAVMMAGLLLGYACGRVDGVAGVPAKPAAPAAPAEPAETPWSHAVLHAVSGPVRFRTDAHLWELRWDRCQCDGKKVHADGHVAHAKDCPCRKVKP